MRPERGRAPRLLAAAACLLAAGAAGCRQNMHNQAKVNTYAESDFFADGVGARPIPAHTVARGFLRDDEAAYTGLGAGGRPVTAFPLPVTMSLLERGQERYNVYCSPCHDRAGTGRGMIVQRGFTQPSSYHIDRLRAAPVGYFYDVITRGFGVMPSYAAQVPPGDRWAIVAYIRALQLSQSARVGALSPAQRAKLAEAWRKPEEPVVSVEGVQVSPETSSGGGAINTPPMPDEPAETGLRGPGENRVQPAPGQSPTAAGAPGQPPARPGAPPRRPPPQGASGAPDDPSGASGAAGTEPPAPPGRGQLR